MLVFRVFGLILQYFTRRFLWFCPLYFLGDLLEKIKRTDFFWETDNEVLFDTGRLPCSSTNEKSELDRIRSNKQNSSKFLRIIIAKVHWVWWQEVEFTHIQVPKWITTAAESLVKPKRPRDRTLIGFRRPKREDRKTGQTVVIRSLTKKVDENWKRCWKCPIPCCLRAIAAVFWKVWTACFSSWDWFVQILGMLKLGIGSIEDITMGVLFVRVLGWLG